MATKRKAKVVKAAKALKAPKTSAYLELNGKIEIVECKGSKEVSREEIDGEVVLKPILCVLEERLEEETK
jgi:hypothetical protein